MPKFRKKPVVIEAFRLPERGDFNMEPFFKWADEVGFSSYGSVRDEAMEIKTLEPSDWIIKGVKGEFYPCKPDIFEATYERVHDSDGVCIENGWQSAKEASKCPRCDGEGIYRRFPADDERVCAVCNGTGKIIATV